MKPFLKPVLAALVAVSLPLSRPLFVGGSPEQDPSKPQAQGPTLEAKIADVLPKPSEEEWLKIPWRSDFAKARAEANRDGKPIFLWMMNGNPLGCT